MLIVVLITYIVYVGIKESRTASNIMVGVKLAIILLVILMGRSLLILKTGLPLYPMGLVEYWRVFQRFLCIYQFDAISTTAEECKDHNETCHGHDICLDNLHGIVCISILGINRMVNYTHLNVGDPLAMVFDAVNMKFIAAIVAGSAIFATAGVLLVFSWVSQNLDEYESWRLVARIFKDTSPSMERHHFRLY